MPTDYTEIDTDVLRTMAYDPLKASERNAILNEIFHSDRRYKEGDADTTEDNKGGIRPRRPNL